MKDHGYRKVMQAKTTEELLEIVTSKSEEYNENALLDAQNLLTEQGIEFVVTQKSSRAIQKSPYPSLAYAPLATGIVFVLVSFYSPSAAISSHQAVEMSIFVNILIRAIVLLWSYQLAQKYKLHKLLWMILGVVFGGWSLIAISFTCFIRATPTKENENATLLINES